MSKGGEFGYEDTDLNNRINHDDDGDGEQEVDTTHPFQPGAAFTPYQPGYPYHGGEQTEMRTMLHEQSGLPSYQEETPLLGRTPSINDLQKESYLRQKLKKAVDTIKDKFPKTNFEKIPTRRGTGKNEGKIVAIGGVRKPIEYKILKDDGSGFMKSFLENFSDQLGPSRKEIIDEDRDTIREQRQRLIKAEKQLQRAETLSSQREEEKKRS